MVTDQYGILCIPGNFATTSEHTENMAQFTAFTWCGKISMNGSVSRHLQLEPELQPVDFCTSNLAENNHKQHLSNNITFYKL